MDLSDPVPVQLFGDGDGGGEIVNAEEEQDKYSGALLDNINLFQGNHCRVKSSSSKIKKPLKRIENHSVRSNGLNTCSSSKDPPQGSHFPVPVVRKISPKNSGRPFSSASGHFETQRSAVC